MSEREEARHQEFAQIRVNQRSHQEKVESLTQQYNSLKVEERTLHNMKMRCYEKIETAKATKNNFLERLKRQSYIRPFLIGHESIQKVLSHLSSVGKVLPDTRQNVYKHC